MSPRS